VRAAQRRRPAGSGPVEAGDLDLASLLLGLVLRQPRPGDLWVGEDDGRNRAWVPHHRLPLDDLHGEFRLVRRLVGQHWLAGDVADREDVRIAGAALLVDDDEALLGDVDARLVEAELDA